MGQEIQSAIQAGKDVTFHERGINAHGFSGYGYIITDPETGGGAYLIEGKGNGGSVNYSSNDINIIMMNTTGSAIQILQLLFLNPGYAVVVGSILGSVLGVVTGLAGVQVQYGASNFCLNDAQGSAVANGLTALGLIGQWGTLISAPPASTVVNIAVYVGLVAIVTEMAYFMKLNAAIGDCK